MKAVVMKQYGGVDSLELTDMSEPQPDAWELKVRVFAAGINPIDWKLRSGALRNKMPLTLPTILGRDVAGEVVEVGGRQRLFCPAVARRDRRVSAVSRDVPGKRRGPRGT